MVLVCAALRIYIIVLFARIILSWFPTTSGSAMGKVYELLVRATEPVLGPIRRAIPPVRMGAMGLDLSPIIVTVLITLISGAICR
ncbi:MAG: YggT family protein [Acidimicrobiales bacterium]